MKVRFMAYYMRYCFGLSWSASLITSALHINVNERAGFHTWAGSVLRQHQGSLVVKKRIMAVISAVVGSNFKLNKLNAAAPRKTPNLVATNLGLCTRCRSRLASLGRPATFSALSTSLDRIFALYPATLLREAVYMHMCGQMQTIKRKATADGRLRRYTQR
jgi:hypothetical protein